MLHWSVHPCTKLMQHPNVRASAIMDNDRLVVHFRPRESHPGIQQTNTQCDLFIFNAFHGFPIGLWN